MIIIINIGSQICNKFNRQEAKCLLLILINTMKKIFFISLSFCSFFAFAQEKNKVFVNSGLSIYPNMKENQRNFNISVSYHRQRNEKWSMEYYFLYSQNDYFPSFYGNEKELDRFIFTGNPETIFEDTEWDFVKNHEIGAKIHYSIYKNRKINLSFNMGLGIIAYKDKLFRLSSIQVDENNVIYSFSWIEVKAGGYGYTAGIFPGVHADYKAGKSFLIALDGGYHKTIDNFSFWNFSIGIGRKF